MLEEPIDLSIIIPVYNHEAYIKQCLETIMYNLPNNSEIIIIDDCCTDNSIEIVKEFHSDKVKIFRNEKNMGCAYSLNKALKLARGKYIGTNNSDDFVENGFYKKMLTVAQKTNADVVCANIADYNDETREIVYSKISNKNLYMDTVSQKFDFSVQEMEIDAKLILGHWTASSASTKIIKRELLEKYPYIGSKANDLTAIYPIMAEAKKVIYMPQLYMFYRQVPNSLSRRNSIEEYNSVVETIVDTMKRLEKIENAEQKIEILFFNNCLNYFMNVLCEIPNTETKISTMKYFITKMKEYRINIFSNMKQSDYFITFLIHNQINEKTYELLEEEELVDFLIRRKIDILVKNNELFMKDNYKLNQMVIKLEEENTRQNTEISLLKNQINLIKQSTSWKITKPIRMLKNLINCIRRHK